MKTKNIRQAVTIKASPHAVYEALMDSRQHSQFTGSKASVSRKVGGKFHIYHGGLTGQNVALVQDKKIVQTWRADDWPKGHFSEVTFALAKAPSGTRLTFTQTGVPIEHYEGIKQGWVDYYWTPMKTMLEPAKTAAKAKSKTAPKATNRIVHVEVVGKNAKRLHEFYSQVFGWTINPAPMNYGMIDSGGEHGVSGGIGETDQGPGHVTFYIEVDDLAAYLAKVEQLGGKTIMAPMEVPGQVTFAMFADPEGHVIGLSKGM